MKQSLYALMGVVVGMLVTLVLVVAVEAFSAVVHPFPADFGGTPDEMCRHVERYPAWVLAVIVPAWAATALVGVLFARLVGGGRAAAVVGLLVLAGLLLNISMLPYPWWFKAATLVLIPAAIFLGTRSLSRPAAFGSGEGD
jgi:hypothetical protein